MIGKLCSAPPKLNGEATRRWNVEAIDGLLDDPEWAKLPQHKPTKVHDENLKLAGCRILDAFIDMSEEQRASRYGSMTQDVHGAPFLDQPRTHAHSLDSLQGRCTRAYVRTFHANTRPCISLTDAPSHASLRADSYFYIGGRNISSAPKRQRRELTDGWEVKLDEDGGAKIGLVTVHEDGKVVQAAAPKVGDVVHLTNTIRDKREKGVPASVKKLLGMKFRKGRVKTEPEKGKLRVDNVDLMPFQFVHVAVHDDGILKRSVASAVKCAGSDTFVHAPHPQTAEAFSPILVHLSLKGTRVRLSLSHRPAYPVAKAYSQVRDRDEWKAVAIDRAAEALAANALAANVLKL
jgi:hypothetical protein